MSETLIGVVGGGTMGQGIAAGANEGDGISVCIDLQGWSALEGKIE